MSRKSQACPCHALPCRKTRPRDDYFIGFVKNIPFESEEMALTLPLVKRNKNEDVTSPFKRASSIIAIYSKVLFVDQKNFPGKSIIVIFSSMLTIQHTTKMPL